MASDVNRIYYDKCLKCRGLDKRPEAQCNCPKRTKEQIKAQAAQIQQRAEELKRRGKHS